MTTVPVRARRHLAKAQEYLEAASVDLELGLFNAATSSAVTAGIPEGSDLS